MPIENRGLSDLSRLLGSLPVRRDPRPVPAEPLISHRRGRGFKSSTAHHAEVAEWQTRYVQGVVSVRAWEFKSPLRHIVVLALVAQ